MVRDRHISKLKMISTITQSLMIVILIVLVVMMMLRINQLQGTARVINYAGLVRGATQRIVKLEMADQTNNDLIDRLDNILNEKIKEINEKLDQEVKQFNKINHRGDQFDINYAHGCAFSVDYDQCTFLTLFNRADKNMYKDKMRSKNLRKKS